jgi:DNA-binding PadR family transcriptional regulator
MSSPKKKPGKKSPKKREVPEISTTAAAILGLISVKRGSAYELAQRMKLNHHFIWPRAESKLYEEMKKLHRQGLVAAEKERTGRRPRTVYRILPLGKRALAAWVTRASEPPSLSFEALVKLAYADSGSVDDARAHVQAVRKMCDEWIALGRSLAAMYLEERVELPERAHENVLVWRFLAGYTIAMAEWADAADAALARWDGVRPSARNAAVTRDVFADGLRRFDALATKKKK